MLLCMVLQIFILYVNPRVFIHLEMLSVRDIREELQFIGGLGFVLSFCSFLQSRNEHFNTD